MSLNNSHVQNYYICLCKHVGNLNFGLQVLMIVLITVPLYFDNLSKLLRKNGKSNTKLNCCRLRR